MKTEARLVESVKAARQYISLKVRKYPPYPHTPI